ncbi:adenine phosphoribosyltransferase [Candidatus Methylacidiphilum infernorum]|uniref:Adenine phosphoribosyltransferase n=1 Tax=Candidatus Methylacidiphilum infernorum TaxID=511746 RepID=A0ABX7PU82_9BACT|nr:adenine phosphoribosyltransferase [Candidatus Methylacidiphilum infernorum]QSR86169.1 adenine phosphoribosyltransferase [Candidatus Methylacidiphilum infernorum]
MTFVLSSSIERLKEKIRTIPDFPRPGVMFKDITPAIGEGQFFRLIMTIFIARYQKKKIDKIAAIDARGFIFAGALAHALGVGIIPIRKKGKLPYKTYELHYKSEYGEEVLTIHQDAISKGENILIVDDVLATGNTARTAALLVEKCGGNLMELGFLAELSNLKGRERLFPFPCYSILQF